jgi:phosphotransferase system enzyme I (PtsI)
VKLSGIAASPGIGLGKIYRLEPEVFAVRDTPVPDADIEREIERFRDAVAASRRDLSLIRDRIAAELGEDKAHIYDAHMLVLDDPELLKAMEHGVRHDRHYPGFVFRHHMSAVASRLDTAEDETLRQRRDDILDVERRVLRHLVGARPRTLAGLDTAVVIVAHELGPSEVALLDPQRVLGFVTEVGGRTSHSAIVARGRGIPAVVGVRGLLQHVKNGDEAAVDGYAGQIEINPDATVAVFYRARRDMLDEEARELRQLKDEPAVTLDGRRIELGANIELPTEVDTVLAAGADGIGLFRTEFFYLDRLELPSEEEQYLAYRGVAERLAPRPVIFRTMDLGGDKVASYLGTRHESNPFLGWRGIRLALDHPELFRAQIRAIYRASAHGRVRMMFPMVSSEEELLGALEMCHEVESDLARSGVPHDPEVEIGVMIETPSAVWIADVLSQHVKFLSIGSNDLTQYTLAMDRDNERLASLYEPLSPAVLRSIRHTVEAGHAAGRWVGICGEMAGDPRNAVLLVGLEVDELSMSCFDLPRVKAAIRSVNASAARALAREALTRTSAHAIKDLLRQRVETMLPSFLVAKRSPL